MPTAIFFDLENFKYLFKSHPVEKVINKMKKLIDESPITDKVILKQAFISKTNDFSKEKKRELQEHGIEIIEVKMPCQKNGTNNMVDFKMYAHIADYVARIRKVKTIILATGDGDFVFLCELIKSKNKNIVILSDSTKTNRGLIKICDDWIDLNNSYNYKKISVKTIFKDRLSDIEIGAMSIEDSIKHLDNLIVKDVLLKKLILKKRVSLKLFLSIAGEYIDLTLYKNLEEQKLENLFNYLLWDTELKLMISEKNKYIYYNPEETVGFNEKYKNLYNSLIYKTPEYDKNKMLDWYTYFKENKLYIKEMLYYGSMYQSAPDMLNYQGNSDIKIRLSELDKEKIIHWKRMIDKDNLNVSEMFYYYEFLQKNKIIYEENEKYYFTGKTKYKKIIEDNLLHELDKLKLTVNEAEIKRLKRKL
ncbi:MAG TPA: hypothetical protein DIV40_04255 [Clostridiales bacterium]|jgi:uncharacterized LabA/DUF88 family protein|nr:hypothetical protein [Clostridiales bacterium]